MDHLNDLQQRISNCNLHYFLLSQELMDLQRYYIGLAKISRIRYNNGLITKAENDYNWIMVRKIGKQIRNL